MFGKKADLVSLKSEIDILDIDELETIPTNVSTFSNAVDNVIKNTVYDQLVK